MCQRQIMRCTCSWAKTNSGRYTALVRVCDHEKKIATFLIKGGHLSWRANSRMPIHNSDGGCLGKRHRADSEEDDAAPKPSNKKVQCSVHHTCVRLVAR
jgi:hypothetical protein